MIRLSSVQGIVLYAMICGRLPFINPQMKVLCNLILNSKIPEIDASDGLFLVLEASSHPLYVYRSYREGAGRVTKHNMVVFDVILRSHIHTHIHLHTHTYTHTHIYIYIYIYASCLFTLFSPTPMAECNSLVRTMLQKLPQNRPTMEDIISCVYLYRHRSSYICIDFGLLIFYYY